MNAELREGTAPQPDEFKIQNSKFKILVIKPSSLGDVVHTLPAVALVKRRWPDAHLRWLINPEWAPLLEGNRHVDEVVLFPRREFRGVRGALRIAPWARELRERINADLVLDFQGLLRSALIAKLARGAQGRIIGLSDAREGARFFYDQLVDVSECVHAVDRYLALVRALGIEGSPPLSWPLPEGTAPARFAMDEPYVLLHPFARGRGKSLSAADVTDFCRALAPVQVVVAGRADAHVEPAANVIDFLNQTTLPELIYLIRRARWVVSVDSGPMHIADAITSRLVSIHTWSDPRKVGPYRPKAWIWKDGTLFQMQNAALRQPAETIRELATFVARGMSD